MDLFVDLALAQMARSMMKNILSTPPLLRVCLSLSDEARGGQGGNGPGVVLRRLRSIPVGVAL